MVKEFLMKKLLISLGVFACVTVNAQTASDSVVMTVAGKQVPLSESPSKTMSSYLKILS